MVDCSRVGVPEREESSSNLVKIGNATAANNCSLAAGVEIGPLLEWYPVF